MTIARTAILISSALLGLVACAFRGPMPPEASGIDRIDVSFAPPPGVEGTTTERAITDRATIERFVAFVEARDDDWIQPKDHYPRDRGTIECRRGDAVVYWVWLGSNWIGGWEGAPGGPKGVRILSAEDTSELREILGIAGD